MSRLYGEGPRRGWPRRVAAGVAVLAFTGAIAVIVPGGARGVTDIFRVSDGSAATPTAPTPAGATPPAGAGAVPTTPGSTTPLVASEAPVPPADIGSDVGSDIGSDGGSSTGPVGGSIATPTTAAAVEVDTLQTVPALRDVIIEIDGTPLATDALGRVAVPAALRHGTIEVMGQVAEPMLQQVTFARWADGGTDPSRPLDTLIGPIAQIGLTVLSNVVVQTSATSSLQTTVRFVSAAGAIDLDTATPTWVVATRVLPVPGGIVAEPITYQAAALIDGDRTVPLAPQAFFPTPEALWEVQI